MTYARNLRGALVAAAGGILAHRAIIGDRKGGSKSLSVASRSSPTLSRRSKPLSGPSGCLGVGPRTSIGARPRRKVILESGDRIGEEAGAR
jgi:hypothetical protein